MHVKGATRVKTRSEVNSYKGQAVKKSGQKSKKRETREERKKRKNRKKRMNRKKKYTAL